MTTGMINHRAESFVLVVIQIYFLQKNKQNSCCANTFSDRLVHKESRVQVQ